MKITLVTIICLFSLNSLQSQTIKKTINEKKFGSLECEYYMDINGEDTIYNLSCSFQNRKYTTIIDIGSIFIYKMSETKSEVRRLIVDLEKCLPYLEQGDVTVSIGQFQVYDFSSQLYINDGAKYTTMSKAQVKKWIQWLKTVVLQEAIQEN
jgi:hypothetical protein